jgi:LAO/AO transport system kinase
VTPSSSRRDPSQISAGLRQGDRLQLARAITLVENEHPHAHALLAELYAAGGRGHIIGITGAPGTGKSTLVTALAQAIRAAGQTVAIVAIDPTSPFTGGAILGDRVRMRALAGDPGIFIRSMATRGSLGGLSKTTGDVVTLFDAAGFDRILVETVGVGQAEVEIASTAHTTLVVEAPGMGDEVQAIKAGILEIADILVVNKADRPGVDKTVQALEMMLEIEQGNGRAVRHHGQLFTVNSPRRAPQPESEQAAETTTANDEWQVTVVKTVASNAEGVGELLARIDAHRVWLQQSGEWAVRERLRVAHTLENILRAELTRRIVARLPAAGLDDLVEAICRRESNPYSAADLLTADW